MRKVLVVILALCIGTLSATAYGWSGYADVEKTDDTKKEAEEILKNAEFREVYSYRLGNHYVLTHDGKFVGVVWSSSKDSLSVGDVIPTAWGAKVMLLQNGAVVGQLFVGNHPGHHWKGDYSGNGHENRHGNHCMQNWNYSNGIKG